MRIGVNVTHLSDFRAGIGTVAANLLQAFRDSGSDDEFFLYAPGPVHLDFDLPSNFILRQGKFPSSMKHLWIGFQAKAMKRDGIEAYLGLNYMMPFWMSPGRRSAIYVYDLAHRFCPETMTRRNRWGMRILFDRSLRRADVVLTCTQTVRKEMIDCTGLSPEKIKVVPLAADPCFGPLERNACLEALGEAFDIRPPYLLFTGTLEPRKNLKVLLKAMTMLHEGMKDLRLVLVGHYGWKSKDLHEEIERLGIGHAVTLTGFVSSKDLRRLYCAADVFVYPSLYEGFGLPILEAMQSGTPVVTSNASCMPEVAGGAALLADPQSPKDLADKVRRVLEDDDLSRELGQKGRDRAEEFAWDKTARAVLDQLKG